MTSSHKENRLEIIRRLLSRELLNPNMQDRFGNTPLHVTALIRWSNIEMVREFVNSGANPNLVNRGGFTPLHYAVICRNNEIVEELLQAGADINAGSISGYTALHFAIANHGYECLHPIEFERQKISSIPNMTIIKMLLQHKNINIDAIDAYGETPLMWSVIDKRISVVKKLLLSGANPNICNTNGESPLHITLHMPRPEMDIVYLLLQYGADLYSINRANQTPIDVLVDSVINKESLNFAKMFVKIAAVYYNLKIKAMKSLERDSELTILLLVSMKEVRLMKKQIITRKLTVHDFMLDCFNENQFEDVCVEIHKPLVDILMKELYSVYLIFLLNKIGKFNLWKVLRHNICLKNEVKDFQQIPNEELLKLSCNVVLSDHLSDFDLFKLIRKYST